MKKAALPLVMAILMALPHAFALAEEGAEAIPSGRSVPLVSLTVGTVESASAGETVSVPIQISDCNGVDSLEMRINYDAEALKFRRVVKGDVFESEFLITNPEQAGLIRVAAASAYGLTKAGTLLTLEFTVQKETGGGVVLTDLLLTKTDPENGYAQSDAYLSVTDGGVSAGGSVPALAVTPWPVPTPLYTPTPEPTLEPEKTPVPPPAETPMRTPAPTMTPLDQLPGSTALELFAAALAAIAILIVVILLLSRSRGRNAGRRR